MAAGSVLQDLDFPHIQDSILLSAEEGVEKPSQAIFMQALDLVNSNRNELQPIRPKECLHVGDELEWSVPIQTSTALYQCILNAMNTMQSFIHTATIMELQLLGSTRFSYVARALLERGSRKKLTRTYVTFSALGLSMKFPGGY